MRALDLGLRYYTLTGINMGFSINSSLQGLRTQMSCSLNS